MVAWSDATFRTWLRLRSKVTKEFAAKILEVVPSERIKAALDDRQCGTPTPPTTRSSAVCCSPNCCRGSSRPPVRWIETQALLFNPANRGGLGVEEYAEVGLGNSPTLANLGSKTLRLARFLGL